jgi:ankyrin repeat protein
MVHKLLELGADMEARNAHHFTPLMAAARYSDVSVVKALIAASADVNAARYDIDDSPIVSAVIRKNVYIATVLINANANINTVNPMNGDTPLMISLRNNDAAMAQLLVASKADLTFTDRLGNTPLVNARRFCPNAIDAIMAEGGVLTPKNKEHVHTLADFAHFLPNSETVIALEKFNADPNSISAFGVPAVVAAVRNRDVRILRTLLNHKGNVNAVDLSGRTALWKAVSMSRTVMVKRLIRYKANVDTPDLYGVSPLMVAAKIGDVDIVTMLLNANVNVNACDIRGRDAYRQALKFNNMSVIEKLLSATAQQSQPNADDGVDGDTPNTAVDTGSSGVDEVVGENGDVNVQREADGSAHQESVADSDKPSYL